jgi:hypothetical protein
MSYFAPNRNLFMKRSIVSEKKLVVVLFILVVVIFSFAQADTKKIEKMYLDNNPSVTTSLDQTENTEASAKTKEIKQIIPAAQLR